MVVSHSNSTSNHNIIGVAAVRPKVVSHSNSTSNHNISLEEARLELLFLIPILHQTTTYERSGKRCALLFLIPILHQTTTAMQTSTSSRCCFSFQFYIKPQRADLSRYVLLVVSHSNSTSNHNVHQCVGAGNAVVSHSNSTSNHNAHRILDGGIFVVSHSNSTSNHNTNSAVTPFSWVVSHSNSTSNHNAKWERHYRVSLFLIPILHQTTTISYRFIALRQLFLIPILHQTTTQSSLYVRHAMLFLIPILHQTTTSRMAVIHILHVTHMTPMHKTSCRTPGKLVGCNFVFQRAIYQKNSSC